MGWKRTLVRRKVQNKDGNREQGRQSKRSFMWEDSWKLKEVPGQTSPEGRYGARDKEEGRCSERLFNPCFQNKRDQLSGNFWRWAPNWQSVEERGGVPAFGPVTVEPFSTRVVNSRQEVHVFVDEVRIKRKGIEDGLRQPTGVGESLEGRHPDSTAQAVSPLLDHDEAWYMDHLKVAAETKFEDADGLDEAMEPGRLRRTGRGDPVHGRVVGKIKNSGALESRRLLL
jgi:hypothetical protein